ncbi:hypothetical protein SGFS_096470 [Streptomyces graminofaciens]|uniref:Uncharacterized protein n=1 Tax=Streptomyces graminofaciens TaxID=68212 RepID=A0ABN5W1U4_9ACTN|nr:hypothetical protein [Streptomyces graminofaciens]BBC38353.1 hypothetical protein SGFS_096470 [Streptomyces graminofaciens]
MPDGCPQAMAFLLGAAAECTIDRVGRRFEPGRDGPVPMVCGGQVTRAGERLTYQVFVAVRRTGAPVPPRALGGLTDHRESAKVAEVRGCRHGHSAMLARARDRPSEVFGATS